MQSQMKTFGGATVLRALVAGLIAACTGISQAQTTLAAPFGAAGGAPAAPWAVVGLPNQVPPLTAYAVVDLDGRRALRIEANASYGNLVHALTPLRSVATLAWRWRADELLPNADLRTKAGDDTALKVCLFFDMALDRVPFFERQLLRLARSRTEQPLPAATVCYVWDTRLPVGTALPNAYTPRVRYKVLQSGSQRLHQWTAQRRDVAADFLELFGDEATEVPPVTGVAVGADADNTQGHSLGHVADVVLEF